MHPIAFFIGLIFGTLVSPIVFISSIVFGSLIKRYWLALIASIGFNLAVRIVLSALIMGNMKIDEYLIALIPAVFLLTSLAYLVMTIRRRMRKPPVTNDQEPF